MNKAHLQLAAERYSEILTSTEQTIAKNKYLGFVAGARW